MEYTDSRIEYRIGDCQDLWSEGDVFVFPEKFNGLSLPLQEAFASGMAVITTDRFPNDTYLPKDLLIPVRQFKKERISVEFDSAIINPVDIASVIDKVYNTDIISYSLLGKKFNEQNSWTQLKNIWKEV